MDVHQMALMDKFLRHPPMVQTVVKAPSNFLTPARNSGGIDRAAIPVSCPKPSPQPLIQKTARSLPRTTLQTTPCPKPSTPDQRRFVKLPPADKGRNGKFVKRGRGNPFEMICVLMPPAIVDEVLELAVAAELPAATIWRRAVILGLDAARAEVEGGIDLSCE